MRTRRACADSLNRDGRVPEALRIEYEIKNYVGSPGVIGVLPARPVMQLDAASDYQPCREALAARGMVGEIATRGVPAPIQASRHWPVSVPTPGAPVRQAAMVHRTPLLQAPEPRRSRRLVRDLRLAHRRDPGRPPPE